MHQISKLIMIEHKMLIIKIISIHVRFIASNRRLLPNKCGVVSDLTLSIDHERQVR